MICFIKTSEIMEIFNKLIENFGGKTGIRDHALLESAIFQPQAFFAGGVIKSDSQIRKLLITKTLIK